MSGTRPEVQPLAVKAATAARLLDVSRAHVYQLIERGTLHAVHVPNSKAVRIRMSEIEALVGGDAR